MSPSVATLRLGGVDHPGGGFYDPGGGPERALCDPAHPVSGRDGDQEPIDSSCHQSHENGGDEDPEDQYQDPDEEHRPQCVDQADRQRAETADAAAGANSLGDVDAGHRLDRVSRLETASRWDMTIRYGGGAQAREGSCSCPVGVVCPRLRTKQCLDLRENRSRHRGGGGNRTRVLRLLNGPSPSAAGGGLSGPMPLPAAASVRIRLSCP